MTEESSTPSVRKNNATYLVTDGLQTKAVSHNLPEAVELTYRLNQENPDRPVFIMEGGLVVIPIPVDNNLAWFIRYGGAGSEYVAIVRGSDREDYGEFALRLARSIAPDAPEEDLLAEVRRYDPAKHEQEYLEKRYPLED